MWDNVESLEHFVFNTMHRRFYERRHEWFELMKDMHFVMWFVPAGHKPSLQEALERLVYLRTNGDSDHAFGWSYLKDAKLWRSRGCVVEAAE